MKIIPILINKTILNIPYLSQDCMEYVYNYVDYKLSPYQALGLFTHNVYSKTEDIIDGQTVPTIFYKVLNKHIIQTPGSANSAFYCQIFNTETQRFYISASEYNQLIDTTAHYALIFTTLYN